MKQKKRGFFSYISFSKKHREMIYLFVLILLLVPMISAVSFDMKANYSRGETIITKISGYFLEPILSSNVFFYRAHVRIPTDFEISKIEDNYYLSADLAGKTSGNYSVVIKNVRHMDFTETNENDIVQNFSITNEIASFSVSPGFVSADKDFSLELKNLIDSSIDVSIRINTEAETGGGLFGLGGQTPSNVSSVTLEAGEIQGLSFNINSFNEGENNVKLSANNIEYNIPVFVSALTEEIKEKNFAFQPEKLNVTLDVDSNITKTIFLRNTGTQTLSDILLSPSDSLKDYAMIVTESVSQLDINQSAAVPIVFFSSINEKNIEGSIKAEGEGLVSYSLIYLNFVRGYVPSNDTETNCASIGGQICSAGQTCSGDSIETGEGLCCLISCSASQQGSSSSGTVVAVIIIIVIVGIVVLLIVRKAKGKKTVNLLDVARGKK